MRALDERDLEDLLSEPTNPTREVLADLSGDIVVLGAGGKMGPTLAMMLAKAAPERNIYAVSRFSDKAAQARIEQPGIKTVEVDLLDESQYSNLPEAENVFFLAGMKFGSSGNQPLTWAMNSFLPALVARHYKDSKIVAFSTGNVYPLVDITRIRRSSPSLPETSTLSLTLTAVVLPNRPCPVRSENTPSRASAGKECSSIFRSFTTRL
jgi:nucleoside-diphosphate-sugar epimerase